MSKDIFLNIISFLIALCISLTYFIIKLKKLIKESKSLVKELEEFKKNFEKDWY